MAGRKAVLGKETFAFFRALARNNHKEWMDENRARYRECIVRPMRRLFEELTPVVLELNGSFDVCGKTGANFSRINRDIRFANDKTLYKSRMYVKFEVSAPGDREGGQLYVGLAKDVVTVGFRLYCGAKRRESLLALVAEPRVAAKPKWMGQQKRKLGRKYESYWYANVKGEWTKQEGWPEPVEDWKKIRAWIVRKKMSCAAATRNGFSAEVGKVFRDLYPLLEFTSLED
jgi:uncharacterized protein (TIGR02453 family)